MKKIFLYCMLLSLEGTSVSAQKKSPGFGAGYINMGCAFFVPSSYNNDPVIFPAFTFTPGVKFLQDRDFAIVLNFPLSAGLTFKSDAFAGIDLPAMLNLHFGSAAGNNPDTKFGFIFGAGVAYMNVVNNYDNAHNEKQHTEFWGYRFNAGVTFKESSSIVPAIICSYGKSITKNVGSMVGIGLQLIVTDLNH